MTIAFGAIGARSAGGTTTISVAAPTGIVAGNMLVAARCVWLSTGTASNEGTWTAGGDLTGGTGTAADSHTSRARIDYKIAVGGEGTVTFDQAGTLSGAVGIQARYTKTGGSWLTSATSTGTDNTHGTNRSVTASSNISFQPGDMLIAVAAIDTDTSLASASATLTASGITFGVTTRRYTGAGVTTGVDGNVTIIDAVVTAGTGTVAPVLTLTTSTSQCGPVSFLRLREVPPVVQTLESEVAQAIGVVTTSVPVTHIATGSRSTGGTTQVSPSYPSGVSSNRLALLSRVLKPEGALGLDPAGYVVVGLGIGGTGSAGDDVGQTKVHVAGRVLDGSESGTVVCTQSSSPNSVHGVIQIYSLQGPRSWDIASVGGSDNVHGTGRSVTSTSTVSIAPDDVIVAVCGSDTDTTTAFTSPVITASGITFGTTVERLGAGGVATGLDTGLYIYEARVTAGTATVAPVLNLSSGPSNCGPVVFIRLRRVPSIFLQVGVAVETEVPNFPSVLRIVEIDGHATESEIAQDIVPLIVHEFIDADWRTGDDSRLTKKLFTVDGAAESAASIEPNRLRIQLVAGGSLDDSQLRELYVFDTESDGWIDGHAETIIGPGSIFGTTADGDITAQHGIGYRYQESGGVHKMIAIWQNIVFLVNNSPLVGVWQSNTDGTDFINRQYGFQMSALSRTATVTAASRLNNEVTLTVTSPHPFELGDPVIVNLTDNTFDFKAISTYVDSTTIRYIQAGSDDADGGTGTVNKVFPYAVEARVHGSIIDVRCWPPENDALKPEWSNFDPTAGAEFPGTTGNYASTPDAAALDITGDLTLQADFTPNTFPEATTQNLIGKFGSGNRSYNLRLAATTGRPAFSYALSGDGGTALTLTANATPILTNGRVAIKVSFDADNGAGGRTATFYTAPTMLPPLDSGWVQLGTPQTTAGTATLFSGSAPLTMGAAGSTGTENPFAGRIHGAVVRDGIDGAVVADFHGASVSTDDVSFVDRTGLRTWTMNGTAAIINEGSAGGADTLAFSTDINEVGTEADRIAAPAPVGGGKVGVISAHLGSSDLSNVTFGPFFATNAPLGFVSETIQSAIEEEVSQSIGTGATLQTLTPNFISASATLSSPTINGPFELVTWQTGDDARFTQRVLSAADNQVYDLSIINGMGDIQAVSGDGPNSSNQREVFELEGTHGLERGKALLYSGPVWDDPIIPQHGLAFRLNEDVTKRRAIIIWQNAIFNLNYGIHAGVWTCDLDGTGFVNRQASLTMSSLLNSKSVSAASRTSNVDTLTVGIDHGFVIGDRVNANLTDDTFDGSYIVSATTSTTISYPHTAGDDADGGTGSVYKVFPYWLEAKIDDPTTNIVNIRAYNPEDPVPDWTSYDPTAGLFVETAGAGSPLSTPDHASLDITGDTTFMAEVTLPDWTPAVGNDVFIAKRSVTAGQFSYIFGLENGAPAGRLTLFWTSNGSSTLQATSTVVTGISDGQRAGVAATIDVDNGASGRTITFYTAPSIDGPWTQLGDPVVQATATSIFASTSPLEIGSQQAGTNGLRRLQSGARIHAAKVRAGGLTGSAPVVDFFGPHVEHGDTSFGCRAGKTFTVASPGAITNAGIPSGATGLAFTVDLDQTSSEAVLAANPTPTELGPAGLVAAHIGTDDTSRCVYGISTFGFIPDSIITPAAINATATLHEFTIPVEADEILPDSISAPATAQSPTVVAGVVTLTPTVITATATLHQPTVLPGVVTLTPNVISAPASLQQPTIAASNTLIQNTLNAASTLQQPTVTASSTLAPTTLNAAASMQQPALLPGLVNVVPNALSATVTVHQPAVVEDGALLLGTINAAVVMQQPTLVPGSVSVTPNTITTTATLQQPLVAIEQILTTTTIDAPANLQQPTVAPGTVTLTPGTINATATLHQLTTAIFVTPTTIVAAATVGTPNVAIEQALIPTFIAASATLQQPTLLPGAAILTPNAIAAPATLNQPAIARVLAPNTISNMAALQQPTVAPGAATIAPVFINAAVSTQQPMVAGGIVNVAPNPIDAAATVQSPFIIQHTIADVINAAATTFAPDVLPGQVVITPTVITASSQLFDLLVQNFAADANPISVEFVSLDYTVEYTTPSYSFSGAEGAGDAAFSEPDNTIEFSSEYVVVGGTPSYSVEYTEG